MVGTQDFNPKFNRLVSTSTPSKKTSPLAKTMGQNPFWEAVTLRTADGFSVIKKRVFRSVNCQSTSTAAMVRVLNKNTPTQPPACIRGGVKR